MTLQQMEYITAVARLQHFAKAAGECGVTQPTLSTMIRKLEEELGVTLFERSSQMVSLTAIGSMVVEQAKAMLENRNRIKEIISEESRSVAGTFRLGILPTIAPYLLPRFMPQVCMQYPETDLRIVEMKTGDLHAALSRNEIDAAIAVNLGDSHDMVQSVLYYEQFVAYVSRESPLFAHRTITLPALRRERLWLLGDGHCFRRQLVRFCKLKSAVESQSTYSLGSIETFMRMVESGLGVTFIPELALEQLTTRQKELVRPFCIPIPVREVVMLTAKNFVRHSVLEMLSSAIVSNIPSRMLKLNNIEQRI